VAEPMLAEASAGSDDADLAAFCAQLYPRLVGALGLYCGDVELAQELAQETLVRLWRNWRRVSGLDSPSGWAHRVAMNLAVSALRSRAAAWRAHRRLAAQWTPAVWPDSAEAVAVRQALTRLPARQRRALVLRYYADLSVEDTAAAMGCPTGTVKTLCSRAIAALRSMGLEAEG
jgi:RNA polymerase sigma-70 factor, ECF subfamily